MKKNTCICWVLLLVCAQILFAQTDPVITAWQRNTTATTGYGNIITNVKSVHYSNNWVYVNTNDIPAWLPTNVGPYPLIDWWPNNPWFPESMEYMFRIRRNPAPNTGTQVVPPYGHIGIWVNGVSLYNPKDAKSYNDQNIWFQNAYYWEHYISETFDACWGHANNSTEYHTHQSPACLYNEADSSGHSPLIGYAFDGYPIYGAYAYANTDGTGGITRMRSSYRFRNIADRSTLPDGTVLPTNQQGPPLAIIPLGGYIEDYEYVAGLGNLDENNGRFCVTPEYPNGTYAYFATLDAELLPAFPYVIGKYFYGITAGTDGNMGPLGGFVSIGETVQPYPNVPLNMLLVPSHVACSSGNSGRIETLVTGGSAPYTYYWNDANTAQNRTALGADTYSVTISDAAGASITASTTLTQAAALLVNATSNNPSCYGSSDGSITLSVSGGTAPYYYNWGYGITTQNRTGLTASTYVVTVTDTKTCTTTATVSLTQPNILVVSLNYTPAGTGQSNGLASVLASGGTVPYQYLWSNGATSATINNLPAGDYIVTVTDNNGCVVIAATNITNTVPTLGLQKHLDGTLDNGYVLFSPIRSTNTYLIDKCGRLAKTWSSAYMPGQSVYLLPDGHLLRTGRTNNTTFTAGGSGGIIEKIDWNGNVVWSYSISDATQCQHHDIKPMPNGNVLVIAWDKKTSAQAIAQGRDPVLTGTDVWSEKIVELQPIGASGANIVWQWNLWDHLVQNYDVSKPNYGGIIQNPQRININYKALANQQDWIHLNSVDYNAELDQILLSSHSFGEVWIIDHSTTTAQAASSSGGNSGKGGDILYRWGNPPAYERDNDSGSLRKLWGQHNARWIPEGYPYANSIMIFNNGNGRTGGNYSSVDVITPPLTGGYTYNASLPFAPANFTWSYANAVPSSFYATNISGAQPLANGNVLICDGPAGKFFEINSEGTTLWQYLNPVGQAGIAAQGSTPTQNLVFRAEFYPSDYSGFDGQTLTATNTLENSNSISSYCMLANCNVAITLDGSSTACMSGLQTYTASALPAATYLWTITEGDGTIVSGQGTNSIQVQWSASGAGKIEVVVSY